LWGGLVKNCALSDRSMKLQCFHLLLIGGGWKQSKENGRLSGPHFPKLLKPVVNYWNTDVKRAARNSANVSKQH
jgi:hypothetical protein